MNAAQKRFVDHMGHQMLAWGLARPTGRIYAYLLLQPEPVTLDQIARELGIAKSGASVATRHLMGFGMVRSTGEPGTRRLRYAANYDLETMLAARMKQFHDFAARLHEGIAVATAPEAKRHIRGMTEVLEQAVGLISVNARRAGKGRRT
ncbi:MAG TPA: ArsR family transcriptional regulator [Candidatus Limnocylindria bacterium]|nr:ArsR family transcriptional regulator [Candidatus Limnocylindria bacterium]